MPLKLLEEEREIKHKGITFISQLQDKAIPEVYKILMRKRLLVHEVSSLTLEMNEPYLFDLQGLPLISFFLMDVVQISEVPPGSRALNHKNHKNKY